jgi:prepilin-type N-terminal cleavage/methylation domain-containing protein
MRSAGRLGFTLIELLTVIAIIAILAGMIMTVGPRMIERAKLSAWVSTCNQLRNSFVGYFTKYHDTFPPAYGYRYANAPNLPPGDPTRDSKTFSLAPFMARLETGVFGNKDYCDNFSQNYDTDRDMQISWLEFSPIGTKAPLDPNKYSFPQTLYRMSQPNVMAAEVSNQLNTTPRPLIYVPVRLDDAQKAVKYWTMVGSNENGGLGFPEIGHYAERWRPNEQFPAGKVNPLSQLKQPFPPAKYDDFVLIGVGPGNSTGGLVTPPPNSRFLADLTTAGVAEEDVYYYLALRTYYLATRDINNNGLWDFDYRNRSRKNEDPSMLLPDGSKLYGPLIYLPNNTGY